MNTQITQPFNPNDFKSAVAAGFASGELSLKPVSLEEAAFVRQKLSDCERAEKYRNRIKSDPDKAALVKRRDAAYQAVYREHKKL